ncbi:LysR family transcriptional regulator [Pseudomonas sp. MWU12-2345]|uniref:LysR family transcriptional regulator n=1 Tax=Pseudomonas sp. MWU12-2345 TaxID=2928689 RepID=UPI00200C4776|nr:LysR family transcriptional regulator [Pseudomonas sp. MWU12-2345]
MDSTHRVRAILSFVQAADTGGFAAAARALGVSSAAVSKNVAGLEKALGVRLLNRTTRTLKLTEEGRVFLRQARLALEALDTAVDTLASLRETPHGRVRISSSVAFGERYLAPVLPDLLDRYPGLSVEVDFDDRVVDLVGGGYDLAIRGGNIRDSALISRPICHLNTVIVASPEYLARHGAPESVESLQRHRLIARRFLDGVVACWSFQSTDGSIITVDPSESAVMTLSSPEGLVKAASAGVGVAEVAVHLAWEHLVAGRLKVLLSAQHHPGVYELVIQYPHRALMAPRVRVTVEYLLQAFAAEPTLHIPIADLAPFVVVNPKGPLVVESSLGG